MDHVILVDKEDNMIGTMEKMEAHQKGALHRAFSILVFNSIGEMLIQKRAKSKYHSGGLWTNACCSHPVLQENIATTARKRLQHEMGIDSFPEFLYKFTYQTNLDKNLIEHEVDHVFKAIFNGTPAINLEEAEDWKYISLDDLKRSIDSHPQEYTHWFKLIIAHSELVQAI
jgi:isopentenyl-diphosphate Delta-isomerase